MPHSCIRIGRILAIAVVSMQHLHAQAPGGHPLQVSGSIASPFTAAFTTAVSNSVSTDTYIAALPDAPSPTFHEWKRSVPTEENGSLPVRPEHPHVRSEIERNTQCENGELHGKPCGVNWAAVVGSSMLFLSMQHSGNLAMDEDAQQHFLTADFWHDYQLTLQRYRYNRWNDDDPFAVDYIAHPLMGGITNSIYEQNDPKQRALSFENSQRYWMGRLRATAYSAIYSAQWKVGPVSESSMGNIGIKTYYSPKLGRYTNETGMVDFFVTPVGGLLWNVGEDYVDKIWFRRITHHVRNPFVLLAASVMTPARSGANLLRFRAPCYRDRDASSPVPLR